MIVAITGFIGSGKSLVGRVLRQEGKTVVDCDAINAELLSDGAYLAGLAELFPQAFFHGVLNKKKIAELIFSDEIERKKLNDYAHPVIFNRLKEIIDGAKGDVFVEIPLLTDIFLDLFDKIVVVDAKEKIRTARIAKRDKTDLDTARKKVASQKTICYKNKPIVYIKNDKTEAELIYTVKQSLL